MIIVLVVIIAIVKGAACREGGRSLRVRAAAQRAPARRPGNSNTPGLHHKISAFSDPDPGKS